MFGAYKIGQPAHGEGRVLEIIEFACAIEIDGIVDDGAMQMLLVGMDADDKSVFAFEPAHRRFVPHVEGFLGRYLTRLEALPQMVEYDVFIAVVSSGVVLILTL